MWALIYLLIFLVPVGLIGLVFLFIGAAGFNIFRTGKRGYQDIKPYINKLTADAKSAQAKGMSFADRANALTETFQEIGGRWQFVSETLGENKKSPVVTVAGLAGRIQAMAEERKKPG